MLLLIDSSNLVYRCFYAIRQLTTSRGLPTNALHGVLKTLRMWIRDFQPEGMAMVVDGETPQERLDLIPGYKASRPPMPEDLEKQLPMIEELVGLLGVPQIEDPKQEADDLIASLAVRASGEGREVVIASNDKDFFQLIRPGVRILRQTSSDAVLVDEEWLVREWGLRPGQIVDYLSLTGDSVDEVKGVPGVGEKTALKWLSEFPTLEAIFENLDRIPERHRLRLQQERERLFSVNRKVLALRTDLVGHVGWEDLKLKRPDYDGLCRRLRELEFKTLPAELEKEARKARAGAQGELF